MEKYHGIHIAKTKQSVMISLSGNNSMPLVGACYLKLAWAEQLRSQGRYRLTEISQQTVKKEDPRLSTP